MIVNDLGLWTAYKPEAHPHFPEGFPRGVNLLFVRDGQGHDFYSVRPFLQAAHPNAAWALVLARSNRVIAVSRVLDVVPENMRLLAVDLDPGTDPETLRGKLYDEATRTFADPPPAPTPELDPAVKALQATVASLTARLTALEARPVRP